MKKRMDPFEQKLFQIADQEKMILPDTLYEKTEHTLNHLSNLRQQTGRRPLQPSADGP